jgi:hypothetical protein
MCSAIKIIYGTLPRVTLNKKATQLAVCDLLFQEPLYGTTAALESMWIPFGAHCKDPYNEVSCGLFARPKHKPQRPKYSNSSSNKVLKIFWPTVKKILQRLYVYSRLYMPSSSALIPMSIRTSQCVFSHSFTTYEWLKRDCDVQIDIGIRADELGNSKVWPMLSIFDSDKQKIAIGN